MGHHLGFDEFEEALDAPFAAEPGLFSAPPLSGTRVSRSPVAGFRTSRVWLVRAETQRPLMYPPSETRRSEFITVGRRAQAQPRQGRRGPW